MLALAQFGDPMYTRGEPSGVEHERSISPESLEMLLAGIESAKTGPNVYVGSFAQYADDDDGDDE